MFYLSCSTQKVSSITLSSRITVALGLTSISSPQVAMKIISCLELINAEK